MRVQSVSMVWHQYHLTVQEELNYMGNSYRGYRLAEDGLSVLDTQGKSHALRRKSLLVFQQLSKTEGGALTKQQLIDAVWPGVEVTDDSLIQCIAEIRRVIGDADKQSLQTIPRYGYRLVPDTVDNQSSSLTTKVLLARGLGTLCIFVVAWVVLKSSPLFSERKELQEEARPAILIRQFEDLSGEARWQRLASGLTSELVIELARNSWLRILRLDDGEQLSAEMNEVVAPRFVISGTLQAEAEQLRITSQLKELPGNEIIWSERWDRPAQELFSVQDEILKKINSSMGGAWTGVVAKHGLGKAGRKPTKSLDAYELYLLGVEHKHKFTPEDNKKAIEYLEKAIEIDGEFGQAWSTLSIVYINSSGSVQTDSEALELIEKQMEAATRAYELIPDNPEVLISYSWVKVHEDDQAEVDRLLQAAVQLSWNNPDVLAYATWAGSGRASEKVDVVAWGQRAIELNPNHPEWYLFALGAAQFNSNLPNDALQTLKQASGSFYRWLYEAGSYALIGELELAKTTSTKALLESPEYSVVGDLRHDPIIDSKKKQRYLSSLSAAGFK